jgi:hypothetical protein
MGSFFMFQDMFSCPYNIDLCLNCLLQLNWIPSLFVTIEFIDSCPDLSFYLHVKRRDPRGTAFAALEAVLVAPVIPI